MRPTWWRCASSSRPPPRPLTLVGSDRTVQLCSLLPGAAPALVREDGAIWLGLQVQHSYGDPNRDLAAVLTRALDAEPGSMVGLTEAPGEGPRLQDLDRERAAGRHRARAASTSGWPTSRTPTARMAAALQQANEAAVTDRPADLGGGGVLDLGGQPRVPPLGAARRRGPRARRPRPAARGRRRAPRRRRPADRDVPGARARRTGLGPAARDRRRGRSRSPPNGCTRPCARRWTRPRR